MPTTWSPTNKIASVSLSVDQLTATAVNDGAATFQGGFATAGVGTGEKKCWSVQVTVLPSAVGQVQVGLCTAAWAMNTFGGIDNDSSVQYDGDAHVFVNGAALAVTNAWVLNSVVDFCVDQTLGLLWQRIDGGVWNSGGNPAAGTGGLNISGMSGTLYPCYNLLGDSGGGGTVVLNAGATTFPYAMPAGFTGFDVVPGSGIGAAAGVGAAAAVGLARVAAVGSAAGVGTALGRSPTIVDETLDLFQPFGSLIGSETPSWEAPFPIDPAMLRAHLGKDLLLIAEPIEAGSEGSVDLDIFPPFGSLPDGWSSTVAQRRMIWIAATQGRSTANDDEPPAQYVSGRLQPFNFGARLFEGTDPLSRPGANEGVMSLIDPDGTLNDLISRVWDGTPITLKRGPRGGLFKDWPVVGRFRSAGLVRDLDQKQIQLRDLGWLLAGNLHDEVYLGTGGAEGTVELTGQSKFWALGHCFNIEPRLLSAPDQIFQWSLSSSQELSAFRHGGIDITVGADYADYATLAAATIPGGECATCLAQSLVRPNLALQYDVRVDVIGDADVVNGHPAPLTRAAIIRRIATHRGQNRLDDDLEIDVPSFNRMEAVHSAPVGWFFGEGTISKAEAINRALAGVLGWMRVRPATGQLTIGWVVAPELMTAVITLTGGRDDVGKPRLVATSTPRRGTRVSWQVNNAPQDRSSLSALVSDEDAALYKQPASYGQSLAPAIATLWPTAMLVTVDEAGFRDEADAIAEAARHQDIFSVVRNRWARDIQIDPFFDILGEAIGIADDALSSIGPSDHPELCVAIESVGTSVQTLEFFT